MRPVACSLAISPGFQSIDAKSQGLRRKAPRARGLSLPIIMGLRTLYHVALAALTLASGLVVSSEAGFTTARNLAKDVMVRAVMCR